MKQLTIIRHAKSSWSYQVNDKHRSLTERGINDALLVSKKISNFISPDAVFSSPAIRALHTCLIFMQSLAIDYSKLSIAEDLYDFSGEAVTRFVQGLNESYASVMIFGHNDAFITICNSLGDHQISHLPTSGVVKINFEVEHWSQINKGKITQQIFPKDFK